MPTAYYTLITGASKGFGRSLALECASRNWNVILVSLPGEGLAELATEISTRYPVNAVALEIDLSTEDGCQHLHDHVFAMGWEVNILLNNAGIGCTELFSCGELGNYQQQIRLNISATTAITYLFIPMLKRNCPSYILNVGSLASFFCLPKKGVYGATKSFLFYFTKSLRRELKSEKIYVSVVCPGGMYTNNSVKRTIETGRYLSRVSSMEPEAVAPIAIKRLLEQKAVIIPGKINATFVFLASFLPSFIVGFFENRAMRKMHSPPLPASLHKEEGVFFPSLLKTNAEKLFTE